MKTTTAVAILLLLSSVAALAQTGADSGLMLVPINPGVVSGANGTQWTTTLWAYNSGLPIAVNCAQLGLPVTTCPAITPNTVQGLQSPPYAAGHPGYFLQAQEIESGTLVPLRANHLWLDLRSVDSATAPSSAGVQIPLPRVDEFLTNLVVFPHVPLNGHSRLKLRVYGMTDSHLVDVRVFGLVPAVNSQQDVFQKDMLLHEEVLSLLGSVPGKLPSYAELDLPAPDTFPAITVVLTSSTLPADVFFWAFVTVTDNQSEQVTIVTPRSPVQVTPTGSAS